VVTSKARSYLRSCNDVCSIVAPPLGVLFRVTGVGLPIQFDERCDARLIVLMRYVYLDPSNVHEFVADVQVIALRRHKRKRRRSNGAVGRREHYD